MSTTRPQLLHSFGAVGEGRKRKRSLPAVHSSGQTAAGLPVRAAGWCELPHEHRLPLWRWLTEDAIRPWSHRSWIFPRAPHFKEKASRVLDLYEGRWKGRPLTTHDCVLSADEKTSIQARRRRHPTLRAGPARAARIEHEYEPLGAWAYLAAWDVRRAKLHGRCEPKPDIPAFERLVDQVMRQKPYRTARRVFWVLDNGSSHRGEKCIERLRRRWPTIIPVHTPIHASWLNQVEIYFPVVQRKALTPNDFGSLAELQDRLLRFQQRYEDAA